jgi:hypothetical protein
VRAYSYIGRMEKKEDFKISKRSLITRQDKINDSYTIIDKVRAWMDRFVAHRQRQLWGSEEGGAQDKQAGEGVEGDSEEQDQRLGSIQGGGGHLADVGKE